MLVNESAEAEKEEWNESVKQTDQKGRDNIVKRRRKGVKQIQKKFH